MRHPDLAATSQDILLQIMSLRKSAPAIGIRGIALELHRAQPVSLPSSKECAAIHECMRHCHGTKVPQSRRDCLFIEAVGVE
jgi:hypothetical protein